MDSLEAQLRALGRKELPESLGLDGRLFRLERTFQHRFATAVGLYACGEERVVCKVHRRASLFGLPLEGAGRLMAAYETAVLAKLQGIPGVPTLRRSPLPAAVVREFVPGEPLHTSTRVGDQFFPELLALLRRIHERGLAYVDMEKPENILVGEDGRPYLFDFQIAFYVPRRALGETTLVRAVRGWFQRGDHYHAMKHFRKVRCDLLSEEQVAAIRRRPLAVHVGNVLMAPLRLVKMALRRKT